MIRSKQYFLAMIFITLLSACLTGCSDKEVKITLFEDVTAGSALDKYRGMTHGTYWGDFNNDGLPDLYVTNHLNDAQLFKNLGNSLFSDVTSAYFKKENIKADKHGAAWADFNNDGLQDLVQLTGAGRGVGAEPKFLFENKGDKFVEVAENLGVVNSYGRTRIPLWFDLNNDGLLDLFHGAEKRFDKRTPPFVFTQQKEEFVTSTALKFASLTVPYCVVTSLSAEASTDVLCRISGKGRTSQVFRIDKAAIVDKNLLPVTAFNDVAAADFDNNGLIDLFLARKNPPGPIAFGQTTNNEFIADVKINKNIVAKTLGFTFRSEGQMTIQVASVFPNDALSVESVHLGEKGLHPKDLTFTLSTENPELNGIKSNKPGAEAGVYIGTTEKNQWDIYVTAPKDITNKSMYQQVAVKIQSTQEITKLESIGVELKEEKAPARLFMNYGDKFVQEGDKRGVHSQLVAGMNVVAADFDNDMDIDIFLIGSGDIGSQENMLLLNQGDGHFNRVVSAGGARSSRVGVADSVTTADVDNDGFLDLLTSTGGSMGRSLGLPSDEGGYHLYHNVGNDNHWLEIDLQGTQSNRDGIGAVVKLTTGGITQTRVQDGGTHNNSQNHKRLHFGLGKNSKIEKIVIHWPSGKNQKLTDINVDQVLLVKEQG